MAASRGLKMRISKAMNTSFALGIEQVFLVQFVQLDASFGLTTPLESHQLSKIKSYSAHNTGGCAIHLIALNRSVV